MYTVKKEVMLFSAQKFSFRSFYPNATVCLERTRLLRWSWREHCRNSHFLKKFCSPAIIWRRERSLCQQSRSSWPFVTKMRDMQTVACFPEALQVMVLRDGKFPPTLPQKLRVTERKITYSTNTRNAWEATTLLPGTDNRCQQTLMAVLAAQIWTAR